jgi:hypothetical protein
MTSKPYTALVQRRKATEDLTCVEAWIPKRAHSIRAGSQIVPGVRRTCELTTATFETESWGNDITTLNTRDSDVHVVDQVVCDVIRSAAAYSRTRSSRAVVPLCLWPANQLPCVRLEPDTLGSVRASHPVRHPMVEFAGGFLSVYRTTNGLRERAVRTLADSIDLRSAPI